MSSKEPRNMTRQDAYARLYPAKLGSLVNASDTFLENLRGFLCQWIKDIDLHLAEREQRRADREEAETESYRYPQPEEK